MAWVFYSCLVLLCVISVPTAKSFLPRNAILQSGTSSIYAGKAVNKNKPQSRSAKLLGGSFFKAGKQNLESGVGFQSSPLSRRHFHLSSVDGDLKDSLNDFQPHNRITLDFFGRILQSAAAEEFHHDDTLFRDALDTQWALLQGRSSEAAPFIICSPYKNGRDALISLRRDLEEGCCQTVHSDRLSDAICFVVHASYDYCTYLLRQPHPLVSHVEPLPAKLKISPGLLGPYMTPRPDRSNDCAKGRNQGRSQYSRTSTETSHNLCAESSAISTGPRTLPEVGPELILTFAPTAKMSQHLRFIMSRWRKILPKLKHLPTDGFHRHFWTAMSLNPSGPVGGENSHPGPPAPRSAVDPDTSSYDSSSVRTWDAVLARLQRLHETEKYCNFDAVHFRDETPTHLVLGGLLAGMPPAEGAEDEADRQACLEGLVAFIASHPDILSIQTRARYALQNDQATWIIQSGDEATHARPLWDLGLTGKGELIGVADTGLDDESCFFYDNALGQVARSSWEAPFTDMTQRKVVQYVSFVDGGDLVEGHGTHVSGSLAGVVEPRNEGRRGHFCAEGETLACTGMCLSAPTCQLKDYGYVSCQDWLQDGHCDAWFACPLYGCDGGDCVGLACNPNPEEALMANQGMAREAKIAFFDIADEHGNLSTPSDFHRMLFPPAYEAGARIHSNSWGINVGEYLFDDMKIDQYAYEHQDFLIIYAAGNYGEDGFHSIGSPGNTKNVLTVGATESGPERQSQDRDYIAKFSSRGPTKDGRLKPDIVSPGSYIYSARSAGYNNGGTCSYVAMAGTSMAAPVVAGAAALIRQYFKEGHYYAALRARGECGPPYQCEDVIQPSAPLLKALFVNSAVPVKALRLEDELVALYHPPDLAQGHGRIKIDAVLDFYGHFSLFFADKQSLASGKSRAYYFQIAAASNASSVPLQVTLCWIDPPNSFTAQKQLLHDLDLHVLDPSGVLFYPNGLPGPDRKNNVEKIVVVEPLPGGVYTLVVTAGELSEAEEQLYALVATGDGRALTEESVLYLKKADNQKFIEFGDNGFSMKAHAFRTSNIAENEPAQKLPEMLTMPVKETLHVCYKDGFENAAAMLARTKSKSRQPHGQNENSAKDKATSAAFGDMVTSATAGLGRSEALCEHFDIIFSNRSIKCPPQALHAAQKVCLGAKCHHTQCGVSLEEAMSAGDAVRYKVSLRLILRGLELKDFEDPALSFDLRRALGSWLDVDASEIQLLHVNGYRLEVGEEEQEEVEDGDAMPGRGKAQHDLSMGTIRQRFQRQLQQKHQKREREQQGFPGLRLFKSPLHPMHGVSIGVDVKAPEGQAQSNKIRAQISASYGHLTDHLHDALSPTLRQALVYDVQGHVHSYHALPSGVAFEERAVPDKEERRSPREYERERDLDDEGHMMAWQVSSGSGWTSMGGVLLLFLCAMVCIHHHRRRDAMVTSISHVATGYVGYRSSGSRAVSKTAATCFNENSNAQWEETKRADTEGEQQDSTDERLDESPSCTRKVFMLGSHWLGERGGKEEVLRQKVSAILDGEFELTQARSKGWNEKQGDYSEDAM